MSYAGIEIGSPVEDDVIINVVRPQRGEPFYLPDELLEAVDDLATAHNIDWRYRKTSRDLIVAAKAAVYPEDRTLEIEGENGLETLVVPAQHLIAGGLRAAMAFELERMKLL